MIEFRYLEVPSLCSAPKIVTIYSFFTVSMIGLSVLPPKRRKAHVLRRKEDRHAVCVITHKRKRHLESVLIAVWTVGNMPVQCSERSIDTRLGIRHGLGIDHGHGHQVA
jgi:hypothetical protein